MKKIVLVFIICLSAFSIEAKKVKFSVDMTEYLADPNNILNEGGMTITGDFQVVAGLALDSFNTLTPMVREGLTNIYSLVVDIPAFRKYEYRFNNGDQSYGSETIPVASRVTIFNDNRWIYVDSVANDTTDMGAILFAANAPAGMKLVRFAVDAQKVSLSNKGLKVATTGKAQINGMVVIENGIYEAIKFVAPGELQYNYVNGATLLDKEMVSGNCVNNTGNRVVNVQSDTVLSVVCYGACVSCEDLTSVKESAFPSPVTIYQIPGESQVTIELKSELLSNYTISINDFSGRLICQYSNLPMNKIHLDKGIYLLTARGDQNKITVKKMTIE